MCLRLEAHQGPWDLVIVGGGATGVGVAIDAASRGYDVLLLEQHDFGKGTSSRSTKLVHGGVRYLEQGNVSLVMEALKERGIKLPVIAVSARESHQIRETARELGAQFFLHKPVDDQALLDAIAWVTQHASGNTGTPLRPN